MNSLSRYFYIFLNKKWHFDQIINELIVVKFMNFGYSLSFLTIDKGLIERFGPAGLSAAIFNVSFNLTAIQTGYVFHTVFMLVYALNVYFILFFLLAFDFNILNYNVQFGLLFFGYFILSLSNNK
jgi:hypothetical protein